jgi:2-methylisocitrate lyase-like PEP mutase family enzyme
MARHIEALQQLIQSRSGAILPGASNALTARIIEDIGFEALYLTGAGLTNMYLGVPDLGFHGPDPTRGPYADDPQCQ